MSGGISAVALAGVPEVQPGDDLAATLAEPLRALAPAPTDVLVIAHKIVSKAEGRIRDLASVHPGTQARELAERHGKDARHVQVVLDETAELIRESHGVLITVTRQGFVCANAGWDMHESTLCDDSVRLGRALGRRP